MVMILLMSRPDLCLWFGAQAGLPACGHGGICSCDGRMVNCEYKALHYVPERIPTNTEMLYLWGNQLQLMALRKGVFDQLVNLNKLWLNSNQLTSLSAGMFDSQTQLTAMSLGIQATCSQRSG
ncbi:unnamed protein product [Lampetra planeri]